MSSYCYDTPDNQKKAMSNVLSVCTGQACGRSSQCCISHNSNDIMTDDELVNCTLTLEATHGVGVAQSYSGGRQPKFLFSGCNVTINNHYH
uniref:Uncharacterized protein n=1 Tax=Magallana gigas TaxID=29159 RepID=A0A8W8M0P1_MAGGI